MKKTLEQLRICCGCGELLPKGTLLKLTRPSQASSMALVADLAFQVPGRSFYVFPSKKCITRLLQGKKRTARLLQKTSAKISDLELALALCPPIQAACPNEEAKQC